MNNCTKKMLSLCVAVSCFFLANAQVKIGTPAGAPDASAQLEVASTTRGFLMPRLTTAQRNAVSNPAVGLMIFNTSTNQVEVNTGTSGSPIWSALGSGTIYTADGTLTGPRTVNLASNFLQFKSSAGTVDIGVGADTVGSVRLSSANSKKSAGYVSVYRDNTVRVGYMGYDTLNMQYNAELGNHHFIGRAGFGTSKPLSQIGIKGTTAATNFLAFHNSSSDIPYVGIGLDETADALAFRTNVASTDLNTTPLSIARATGVMTVGNLAGTGTRMVVANPTGALSTQAIPSGISTASNGLTATGSNVALGGALTAATTVSGITTTNSLNFTGTGPTNFSLTVTGAAPANSGTTQSAGHLARFADNSGAVLDLGAGGGSINYGYYLQTGRSTSLAIKYPLLLNPNGGSVAVGTAVPNSKFPLSLKGSGDSSNMVAFHSASSDIPYVGIGYDEGKDVLALRTNLGTTNLNTTALAVTRVGGLVGIGTTAPLYQIDVKGSDPAKSYLAFHKSNSDYPYVGIGYDEVNDLLALRTNVGTSNLNTTPFSIVRTTGAVKIDATSPGAYGLYVTNNSATSGGILVEQKSAGTGLAFTFNGAVVGTISNTTTSTSYNTTSDIRLKKNIVNTHYGLSDVLKIEVKDYVYKADKTAAPQTGFIAQQLYGIYPEAVSKGGIDPVKNPWTVDYSRVVPVLTKAIQEQQTQIESLKSDNKKLMAQVQEINEMKEALAQLRAELSNSNNAISITSSVK